MGAANVVRVQQVWIGHVQPVPYAVLIRMAIVSHDKDTRPWYSAGHEDLARFGLPGRHPDRELTRNDFAAVERAVKALKEAGAIYTIRRSAGDRRDGPRTAKYGIRFDPPAALTPHAEHGAEPHAEHVPHHMLSMSTPHAEHVAEESRGRTEENKGRKNGVADRTQLAPPRIDESPHAAFARLAATGVVRSRRFTVIDGGGEAS